MGFTILFGGVRFKYGSPFAWDTVVHRLHFAPLALAFARRLGLAFSRRLGLAGFESIAFACGRFHRLCKGGVVVHVQRSPRTAAVRRQTGATTVVVAVW